jgi:hypothetical protein
LAHDGQIPCVKAGNGKRCSVLYSTAELRAWLARKAAESKPSK